MKYKGELFVILSSIGFAIMPIFAKSAYRGGANVTTVLFIRFTLACAIMWFYIFSKKLAFKINRKQLLMVMLLGVLYSLCAIVVFNSYIYITAGLSDVLLFTYPAWVLIITFVFFKQKITVNKIYGIALSMIGTTLVAYTPGQKFSSYGVFLALLGAVIYGFYVSLIDNGELNDLNPIVTTGYIIMFAMLTFLIYGLSKGELLFGFKPISWLFIALIAFFSTAMAILAFCAGAKLIGSPKAAIVSTFEPIATFTFGFIFLGEKVTYNMIFGGLVVIMAILSLNIFKTDN